MQPCALGIVPRSRSSQQGGGPVRQFELWFGGNMAIFAGPDGDGAAIGRVRNLVLVVACNAGTNSHLFR